MTTIVIPRLIGADDISWGKGSLVYVDVNGVVHTIPQVNASQIPFSGQNVYVEDILGAGGTLLNIAVNNLTAGGTIIFTGIGGAGFVKVDGAGNVTGANTIQAGDLSAGIMPSNIDAAKIANGTVSNAEYQYLANVTSDIQAQINAIIAGAAVQPPFALLQNRQAAGTGGGATVAGSWQICALNTEQEDANNICDSSALPAFSLAAGTYRFIADVPLFDAGRRQIRLYNVTDGSVAVVGGSSSTSSSGYQAYSNPLVGTVTIGGVKQFRVEYQVSNAVLTNGQGFPANFGIAEVYAQIQIWQIA